MINLALAREKFALLTELSEKECEPYRAMVASCVQDLEYRLRFDADIGSNASLLAEAAAADAFYRYCIIEASRGVDTQTVGSVTVRKDFRSQADAAAALRMDSFARIRHLIRDEKFLFVSV